MSRVLLMLLLSLCSNFSLAATKAICARSVEDIQANKNTIKFECRKYYDFYASSDRRFVWHDLGISHTWNKNDLYKPYIAYTEPELATECEVGTTVGDSNNTKGIVNYSSLELFLANNGAVCKLEP